MNYWEENYRELKDSAGKDGDGWLGKYAFPRGTRILDLGCGAGTNLPSLLERGAQVTAADFSENAMELVRAAFGGRLCAADCFDMHQDFPYADGSFDAIVADLSLHYFTWADTRRIVGELRRVLRSGGALIARVHSIRELDTENAERIEEGYYFVRGYTRRFFSEEEIRALFMDWKLKSIEEKTIARYGMQKKVFEFMAERP